MEIQDSLASVQESNVVVSCFAPWTTMFVVYVNIVHNLVYYLCWLFSQAQDHCYIYFVDNWQDFLLFAIDDDDEEDASSSSSF